MNRKNEPQGLRSTILALFLIGALTACSSEPPSFRGDSKGGVSSLSELKSLRGDSSGLSDTQGATAIRYQGLQESALSVGAQAGLAWRAKQINAIVEQHESNLRRVFDFNSMILDHNVLPPVLEEGRDTLKLDSDNSIRLSDRSYSIVSQAHFVTTPPDWRTYLIMTFSPPNRPDGTLLPRDRDEQNIWSKYVETGWNEGIRQANRMYEENLARLKRDYKGMALYRALLAQGMVSKPFVAKSNLGVTGGGDNLRVNDQVLRITALPALQSNTRVWKPVISSMAPHPPTPVPNSL